MKRLILFCLALLLFGAGRPEAPGAQTLVHFQSESPDNWQSGEQPARLRAGNNMPELKLNFTRDDRQITLTRNKSFNLQKSTSFRFRIGITQTEPLLEGSLIFLSGNGSYVHTFTLHEQGLNHLLFSKADFKKEGSPLGWQQIDGIRLAFWPRRLGETTLYPLSLEGFEDQLWVIDPEPLSESGDQIYTSRVSLRHVDRLLSGLGLPHAVLPPSALATSKTPALILLPYLPKLPNDSYQHLNQLIKRGSKIIVFESAHQGFARSLGVELGSEISSSTVGQFDHWKCDLKANPDAPSKIYQHAWNFRQIRPLSGSKTGAVWQDALGRDSAQPAFIESPSGIWANVAWRSGDIPAKQNLLAEWIGRLAPELLIESLRFYEETQSPTHFELRYGNINAADGPAARLKSMALENHGLGLLINSTSHLNTLRFFLKSEQLMQRAFAGSRETWNAELKGIWDQNGTGMYAGSWDQTCRDLKAAGLNAVFSNMASAGRAHYPSRLIPPSKSLEKYGDQLRAFTAAARKHGIQAHAWKICWKLNTRLPAFQEKLRREGRLMQDANGKEIPWLSISHPANVQFEIDSLLEMARHAPLDGLHLDYMRYPGREADYGPAARNAFEKTIGKKLPDWPREVLGPLRQSYQHFRQNELHQAMREISRAVKKEFPELKLSVAVWGAWPDCADAQGQDWPLWAKEGLVDWIIPMNYTDNPDQFAGWLDLQRAQPGVAQRMIPGIGIISSNAELSPAELLRQLDLVKQRNLKGAVLYRLDSSLQTRLYPYLKIWK